MEKKQGNLTSKIYVIIRGKKFSKFSIFLLCDKWKNASIYSLKSFNFPHEAKKKGPISFIKLSFHNLTTQKSQAS
jgi:hypothetical protein